VPDASPEEILHFFKPKYQSTVGKNPIGIVIHSADQWFTPRRAQAYRAMKQAEFTLQQEEQTDLAQQAAAIEQMKQSLKC
jgi:ABC-type sugar transport system substrate-binding protein